MLNFKISGETHKNVCLCVCVMRTLDKLFFKTHSNDETDDFISFYRPTIHAIL